MKELGASGWSEFFRRLNEFARDARLTIQASSTDGSSKEPAGEEVSLERVEYRKEACNDVIAIQTSGQAHTVTEPIRIRLQETEQGAAFNSLIIEAESGATTVMFRPVIRREWLEGLQLA